MPAFEVLHPGALSTVQDLGRPGLGHLGIPRSGAADRDSLRLANRLVGNEAGAACLETTLVGPRLRLLDRCTVALTGAPVKATVADRPLAMNTPTRLEAGAVLAVGNAKVGLRSYVAFGGGIVGRDWFGSRSTDLLTGLGPPALAAGQVLELGVAGSEVVGVDVGAGARAGVEPAGESRLEVIAGPRADCFAQPALDTLVGTAFRVSTESNRIGVRLEGPALERTGPEELPSEGLAHGSLQVPRSGEPILLLSDHPTTGGYPVIAVVSSRDLAAAGQLRPGQWVRFGWATG